MKYRLTRPLLILYSLAGLAFPTLAGQNCAFSAPPRAAAVNANHGSYLFIFPRQIASGYTGCQTMWDERGAPLMVLKFERGALVSYQEFARPKPQTVVTCQYGVKTSKPRSRGCPAREDMEAGFRTMPEASEPPVPAVRDPRRD